MGTRRAFLGMTMNTAIINAMNSVAVAAAAAKDMNMLSVLQDAACLIARAGTAYDTTAYNASATAYINPYITPYNGQIKDSLAADAAILGIPPWQLGN